MDKIPIYLRTCYSCRDTITDANKKILLITSCQHLCCSICVEKCLENHCAICQKKCKVMQVTGNQNNLPEEISTLFRPLQEVQKEMMQWADFNQLHYHILEKNLQKQQQEILNKDEDTIRKPEEVKKFYKFKANLIKKSKLWNGNIRKRLSEGQQITKEELLMAKMLSKKKRELLDLEREHSEFFDERNSLNFHFNQSDTKDSGLGISSCTET